MSRSSERGSAFNPEMVVLRREALGLTQSKLAQEIGVSQAKVSLIEGGSTEPTSEDMDALSAALRRSRRFFFQGDRVYGPGVSEFYHRRQQSVGARVLRQVHATINEDIMTVRRLLRSAEVDSGGFDNAAEIALELGDSAPLEEFARAVRAAWRVPEGRPINSVVATLERAGCLVVLRRFPSPKIDAVSWWVPGLPPVIFASRDIPADRLRHTLCHEVAHLLMHSVPKPEMEREADEFAGAFLVPRKEFKAQLGGPVTLGTLAALKPYWKVSMASLLMRARQVGKVNERQARYLWMEMGKAGYRRREPPELDIERESPRLLRSLIDVHTDELGLSLSDLADLLLMDPLEVAERYELRSGRANLRLIK